MTATPTRTATFLLRQPRQVQGFREVLRGSASGDAPFEQFIDEAEDPSFDAWWDKERGLRDQPVALTMLWIPPGRFWMGSPETEPERNATEGPQRLVQLPGFFMGQTPITQAQWWAVAHSRERPGEGWSRDLKPTPARFRDQPDSDQRPVEQVSWYDAMEFCERLSQRTGRTYTLPSEAQWEYACRAGSSTPFHFGATITPELANYNAKLSYAGGPTGAYREQTTPVGMFPANAWGLHDMHGNVWEWCQDHLHGSYEGAPSDGSAWLDGAGDEEGRAAKAQADSSAEAMGSSKERLLRGGSWGDCPGYCRSASRARYRPDGASSDVGFRVVCLPQDPSLNP